MRYFLIVFISIIFIFKTPAQFQLVKDINTQTKPQSSNPSDFCLYNGLYYFSATSPEYGRELWKTDGTASGTSLVKDIYPGKEDGNPHCLVTLNNLIYFVATNNNIWQLWKSDGTAGGTSLVKDFSSVGGYGISGSLIVFKNKLYFPLSSQTYGEEIWTSDGTDTGTKILKDIWPGIYSGYDNYLTLSGNYLYFAGTDTLYGTELWRSDGTAKGTVMVRDIFLWGTGSDPEYLTDVNGILFFTAVDNMHGRELWISDGTMNGTRMVKDIDTTNSFWDYINELKNINGVLYFSACDPEHGIEPWRSDGTDSGTYMIRDIQTGWDGSDPRDFTFFNNNVYFITTAYSLKLWKTDGTDSGTVLVRDFSAINNINSASLFSYNNLLLIAVNTNKSGEILLKTDGTDTGTTEIKRFDNTNDSYSSTFYFIMNFNNYCFFTVFDDHYGTELWKTDGSQKGTELVKNIYPDSTTEDNYIYQSCYNNGHLYFTATDKTDNYELWLSDGTDTGTYLLKDINPTGSSFPDNYCKVNKQVFFVATDTAHGRELYVTEGTASNTHLVKDITPGHNNSYINCLEDFHDTLAFLIPYTGFWKSDGTDKGTVPLITVWNYYSKLFSNGKFLFLIYDDNSSSFLWKSDLTPTGTVNFKTFIHPDYSGYENAVVCNNELFFPMDDGIHERSLWKSDGTVQGTARVKDIIPQNVSLDFNMWAFKNKIYYAPALDILWVSDGTTGGTEPFDKMGFLPPFRVNSFFVFGNKALIYTNKNSIGQLWVTDGAPEVTFLLKDSFINSSLIMTVLDSVVYFLYNDDTHGTEFWRTDGTQAGTFLANETIPGPDNLAYGDNLFVAGNHIIFFDADDGLHGYELWKYKPHYICFSPATPGQYCAGSTLNIQYNVYGDFNAGNIFTAWLSDSSGSVKSPLNIGSVASNISGNIQLTIPSGLPGGSHYRLRLSASNPYMLAADSGRTICIRSSLPYPAGNISGDTIICTNLPVIHYSVPEIDNADTYVWKLPDGVFGEVRKNNIYLRLTDTSIAGNIVVYGKNGCGTGDSSFLHVSIYPSFSDTQHIRICSRDSFFAGGHYRHKTSIYYDSLHTKHGCDSVIITDLYMVEYNTTFDIHVCHNDSIFTGRRYISKSGTYSDSWFASDGCDSNVVLNVTILPKPFIHRQDLTLYSNIYAGNQWYYNGQPIQGAVKSYVNLQGNGQYFTIINSDSCGHDTSNVLDVNDLGIREEKSSPEVLIYPNPVNDILRPPDPMSEYQIHTQWLS